MWGNPTPFHRGKSIEENIEERLILPLSIKKSFLMNPLTANSAIYRDSFILI